MHRIDGLYHVNNQFTEGNAATGVKATWTTADWLNALQEEFAAVIEAAGLVLDKEDNTQLLQALGIVAQAPVSVAVETNLTAAHGVVFASAGAPLHLPAYAGVAANKRYTLKNVAALGGADVTIDALDAKTIDGEAAITIMPGECVTIVKDGANWQTI